MINECQVLLRKFPKRLMTVAILCLSFGRRGRLLIGSIDWEMLSIDMNAAQGGAYINHTLLSGEKCAGHAMEESYIRDYASPVYDAIKGLFDECSGARNGLAVYRGVAW